MEVHTFETIRSIEREHIRVHLGGFHAPMPEQLAHKLQRPAVQDQVHRKRMPERVTPDLEGRLSPHLCD